MEMARLQLRSREEQHKEPTMSSLETTYILAYSTFKIGKCKGLYTYRRFEPIEERGHWGCTALDSATCNTLSRACPYRTKDTALVKGVQTFTTISSKNQEGKR
jgi:hypothetical protein